MHGDAEQAALASESTVMVANGAAAGPVLDDADRPLLLVHEDPAVGRLRERRRAGEAGDPASSG
jgi:hypothetical protein